MWEGVACEKPPQGLLVSKMGGLHRAHPKDQYRESAPHGLATDEHRDEFERFDCLSVVRLKNGPVLVASRWAEAVASHPSPCYPPTQDAPYRAFKARLRGTSWDRAPCGAPRRR
jgi:hypothetical protein